MPRAKKDSVTQAIDNATLDLEDELPVAKATAVEDVLDDAPTPTDEGWNDFVISKFRSDELEQGKPTVDGLRRMAELLLGPIVSAIPKTVQAPHKDNGFHAVVEFLVGISWDGDPNDIRVFGDVADVYPGNTDPAYARFAVATATTRAEGRALRKALKLRKVVTAEEITTLAVSESGLTGFIANYQIRGVERLCRDLNISIAKLLQKTEFKYGSLTHVPHDQAIKLLSLLNSYLQNRDKIPASIKGFDADWRSSEGENTNEKEE